MPIKLVSPLRVMKNKKKDWILNLNNYRNTHHYTLNTTKVNYKREMEAQLSGLVLTTPICITYILYPKTHRKTDLGNVLSIHQKYFEDALTEYGCIPDDTYEHIPLVMFEMGEVDPEEPRVEIVIEAENEN